MRPFAPRARNRPTPRQNGRRSGRHRQALAGPPAEHAGPHRLPTSFGAGQPHRKRIWNQEVSRFGDPDGLFIIGQGMCAPTSWPTVTTRMGGACRNRLRGRRSRQLFSEPVAAPIWRASKPARCATRISGSSMAEGLDLRRPLLGLRLLIAARTECSTRASPCFSRYENAGWKYAPSSRSTATRISTRSTSQTWIRQPAPRRRGRRLEVAPLTT